MTSDWFLAQEPSPPNLLNRILNQPGLVEIVQGLDAGVLTRLILHIGLEDAGELVAMASADQLRQVFDDDLWHSEHPGQEAVFDAGRFMLWLEIMLETGAAFAAGQLAQFDEDLITLALSRHLLVLDLDALAMRFNAAQRTDEEDFIDKALDSCLCQEIDGYLVIAKVQRGWEAVLALLGELNESHYPLFNRLLRRCIIHSTEFIDDNGGLFEVFCADETLAADMAVEREDRKLARGFVTPSSAKAFLGRAHCQPLHLSAASQTWDPDTRRYFRAQEAAARGKASAPHHPPSSHTDFSAAREKFMALLYEARVLEVAHPMPQLTNDEKPTGHILLARAMQAVKVSDDAVYSRRLAEISYLANVLMVGCPFLGRSFRPVEAAAAALGTCQLGAEYLLDKPLTLRHSQNLRQLTDMLIHHDMVKWFTLGWKILHDQVVMPTAKAVKHMLFHLKEKAADRHHRMELIALTASLEEKIRSAQPWRFLPEMDDLLGLVDNLLVAQWIALLGEYPTLPEALQQPDDTLNAAFISSSTQIQMIQGFLDSPGR